jgi:hypothetical protein
VQVIANPCSAPQAPAGERRKADSIAAWCHDVLKVAHAGFEFEALVGGERISLASLPDGGPAPQRDCGCIQDMGLGALTFALSESGQLDLSATIGSYLPELNCGTAPGHAIRIADLLCHTAGLKAPPPELRDSVYSSWERLCTYLVAEDLRFPPGTVADYEITERILLVRLLRRVLDRCPYDALLEMMPEGLNLSLDDGVNPGLGLRTLLADCRSALDMCESLTRNHAGWLATLASLPERGSIAYFSAGTVTKDYVPLHFSHGVIGYGADLWGQNGSARDGHCAARFDRAGGNFLFGAFPTRFQRETALNDLCHRLGYSVRQGPRNAHLGYLNGFDPARLAGTYDYGSQGELTVGYQPDERLLTVAGSAGLFRCKVDAEGTLSSSFPFPGLWIEPFEHPTTGVACLKIGQACVTAIA